MIDSRISGFHRMSIDERLEELERRGIIDAETLRRLKNSRGMLTRDMADRMVENMIGVFGLPLSIAPNFRVNGKDYVVPMVTEEPSVVAAVSAAALLVRGCGGFTATSTAPVSIGQIHLHRIADTHAARAALVAAEAELIALANTLQPGLAARGGGARSIEIRQLQLAAGEPILTVHLLVDTRDAMGANVVNTMCEGIADRVAELAGGTAVLRIVSNLADRSIVSASARIPADRLGADGGSLRDAIVLANDIAQADPYRAATHNKGIMNGMDAVAVATGNDWRALEAGAHAHAAREGGYRALTSWTVAGNGDLCGELTLPVRMGTVGGSSKANPAAAAGLCIAAVGSSQELGELMTAVGLAQNFAALKALATDGIQRGHMRLHARSVVLAAGVPAELRERVLRTMIDGGRISESNARQIVAGIEAGHRVAGEEPLGRGSAAGKVILFGEHAVVYGRPAVALPLPEAISASVHASQSGTQLHIPSWHSGKAPGQDVDDVAMALLQLVVRRLGLEAKQFHMHVHAHIPPAAGLGSSAALAVAMIRALDNAYSLGMNDKAVNELAFECETISHGTPSGIDNAVAVAGKPVLFRRKGPRRIRELSLDRLPPLVIAWSGTRGSTRRQVEAVRERWLQDKASYERIFDEIGHLGLEGVEALARGDDARLGSLMNIAHGLLNALQVSTPLIEEMVDIARSAGAAGAKLTGAGGGGSMVALCPGRTAEVSAALAAAGFEVINGFATTEASDGQG